MDLLKANLARIRIPGCSDRVCKTRCCINNDTAKSEGGLFVDMSSFLAFGKDGVQLNYNITGNRVYLNIQQSSIGEETYSVVIFPENISLPFPSPEFPNKVVMAVNQILLAKDAEQKLSLEAVDVFSHAKDESFTGPILPQAALESQAEVSLVVQGAEANMKPEGVQSNLPKQTGKKAPSASLTKCVGESSRKSKGKRTNKDVKKISLEQEDAPTFEVVPTLKKGKEFREYGTFSLPVTVSWEEVLEHCASFMDEEVEEYFSTATSRDQSEKFAGFDGEEAWRVSTENVITLFVHFKEKV